MSDYKKILSIALPAMAENFLQFLMGMVDSFLVAHLGLLAISGVALATNIIGVFQAIFIALGAASSALLARSLGEKRREKLPILATEALKVTLLVSLFLGLFSLFSSTSFLRLLGTEQAVAELGGLYLALVGGAICLLGAMTTLGAILRSLGKNRLPMYVSLLSNVLNAAFSALAVFVFQAGIVGVAVGTILARLIACIILWKCLPIKLVKPSWSFNKDLLRLALPAAGERLMMRVGDVVVVALVVRFGTAVLAGNAIGETLTQFNYMPGLGLATATLILVAQASGQADKKTVGGIVTSSYQLAFLSMVFIAGLVLIFAQPLSQLYSQASQATAASQLVILYSFLGTPLTAGTLMYTALWQGLGRANLPFYATSFGMWVIRIGGGYVFSLGLGWGLAGVWLATLLDNGFRFLFLSMTFSLYSRRQI